MSEIHEIYRISLKSHRSKTRKLLRENEQCYNSLKNKDSKFAKAVKALQDLHRRVSEIYTNAPDNIHYN